MTKHKDYIPHNDWEFDRFFRNITQQVSLKATGTNAEWKHIPQEAQAALNAEYEGWYSAFALTIRPHTSVETTKKQIAYLRAARATRSFINQYLRFPPVTDADRVAMDIPNRDGILTPILRPATRPVFTLKAKDNRIIRVDFRDQDSKSKARPYGYKGAVICWAVLDRIPDKPTDLTFRHCATRTPFFIEFQEYERGKTVYFTMYWENEKGQPGPWSDIISTIVP